MILLDICHYFKMEIFISINVICKKKTLHYIIWATDFFQKQTNLGREKPEEHVALECFIDCDEPSIALNVCAF